MTKNQKRTKTGQKKHDDSVLRSAEWYENQNYKVQADLPGYKKPKTINKFIPDLIVQKNNKEIIIEVETKDSNKKDTEQQQAFKNYADKKTGREFRKKII